MYCADTARDPKGRPQGSPGDPKGLEGGVLRVLFTLVLLDI